MINHLSFMWISITWTKSNHGKIVIKTGNKYAKCSVVSSERPDIPRSLPGVASRGGVSCVGGGGGGVMDSDQWSVMAECGGRWYLHEAAAGTAAATSLPRWRHRHCNFAPAPNCSTGHWTGSAHTLLVIRTLTDAGCTRKCQLTTTLILDKVQTSRTKLLHYVHTHSLSQNSINHCTRFKK